MRQCVKMETMLAAAEWNANLYGYDPRTGHREAVTDYRSVTDLMSIQSQDSTDNSAPIVELCVKMQLFQSKISNSHTDNRAI